MPTDRTAYYADTSTPFSIVAITALMADAEADQIEYRAFRNYRPADATARAALSGTYTLRAGDRAYQVDTGIFYIWSGSTWILDTPGLIIPTVSGSGVTVDPTTGLVTFSSSTAIAIDGAFPTAFRKHTISLQTLNNTGSTTMVLRAGGVDDTAAKYDRTEILGRNATASSATSPSQNSWSVFGFTTAAAEAEIELIGAAVAAVTTGFNRVGAHAVPAVSGTSNGAKLDYLTHQLATAYTGFKITFSVACSGTIRVSGVV